MDLAWRYSHVIWTDVVQFFVLVGSAIFVLIYVIAALPIVGLETLTTLAPKKNSPSSISQRTQE